MAVIIAPGEAMIWLDVIFAALYIAIVLGLSVHLLGNFLTGRVYKRFVQKQWPVHEGPPPRFLPRFLHFQHVVSMFALGISGMAIHFPGAFPHAARTFMRYAHFFFMIVVVINLVWRLWFAFLSRYRDYKEFAIKRRDIETMLKVVMYYAFIKPSKPHLDKYNVMQKATYMGFAILLFVQAFTGFALLVSVAPPLTALPPGGAPGLFSPQQVLLGWFADFVGGLANAGLWARVVHYVINWLFIILTTIHAYLSMTEDFPAFLHFFGIGGHEEHEAHDEHHETQPGPLADAGVEH